MIAKYTVEPEESTLHLPRILCLHGGGTNAQIFSAQCRVLKAQLKSTFRLCFANAPFPSETGPDVLKVYKDAGPFRRWLRWQPWHPEIEASTAVRAIDNALKAAMEEDDLKGATGEWVGLLGFSQGAKTCASLLFRQQVRADWLGVCRTETNFRFGILMAGRGPLVSLDPELVMTPSLVDAAHVGSQVYISPDERSTDHVLRLPTIHVHGLRDPGLELHQQLLEGYCDKESTRLIDWDGNHRVPVKDIVVARIVREIFAVAQETGVI